MGLCQGRRETWDETVERYLTFFEWLEEKHDYKLENGEKTELENMVKNSVTFNEMSHDQTP